MDDNQPGHGPYHNLPIPTYEEAISSRPSSSQAHTGPTEISDDAERQGLLGQRARNTPSARAHGYNPPAVESARSSIDSDLHLPEVGEAASDDDEADLVRRDMQEMDFMDADLPRIRSSFSKRFSYITHSLSAIRMPSFPRLAPRAWSLPHILPEGTKFRISLPIVARLFGLAIIGLSIYLLFVFRIIPNRNSLAEHYDPEAVRNRAQIEVDSSRIAEYLRYVTSFDHVAGTEGDLFLAKWLYEKYELAEMDEVEILDYHVYLNYPTADGRRVAIVEPSEKRWEASLEEENVFRAEGSARQQTLNWHGSSRSGNVTGHLIYANRGRKEDFEKLAELGVHVKGSIALVRRSGADDEPGLKVKAAELAGAVGCLIYSDPADDVPGSEDAQKGPWRSPDAVQRGSVGLANWVLGDPLTPGWASTMKAERKSDVDNPGLVNIPSLPLSWRDAQGLLGANQGQGQLVPEGWAGAVPDVDGWWTGSDSGPIVHLQNLQDEDKTQQIWNVRGVIAGTEGTGQRVIVGNHRDAWCFGAIDPGSGTAVMAEVVNVLGTLRQLGWRPLRSIEFLSWDAGAYNMMGSTEYVEDDLSDLRAHAIGYLNVDAGVAGPDFGASASPLFERVLAHVLSRVEDPYNNQTLVSLWRDKHTTLGAIDAKGDYAAFQSLAGASSLDFGFTGVAGGSPRDSCYDTFEWMELYGDPDFQYHKVLAQVWVLLILELADNPLIPYDLTAYARVLMGHIRKLEQSTKGLEGVNVQPLVDAAAALNEHATTFHQFEEYWVANVLARGGFEIQAFTTKRWEYNKRLVNFETDMLDLPGMFPGDDKEQHGVPGREQYKHVLFGPQAWSGGDDPGYFPAVRDAMEDGDLAAVQAQIEKIARIVTRAAERLVA